MNMGLKYPRWQEPLAAAILEFNPQLLPGKLERAEEAIANRIDELLSENDSEHERRALLDGLSIVRSVKRDRLGPSKEVV
jgi:surfactin synthase thioesterase subunit